MIEGAYSHEMRLVKPANAAAAERERTDPIRMCMRLCAANAGHLTVWQAPPPRLLRIGNPSANCPPHAAKTLHRPEAPSDRRIVLESAPGSHKNRSKYFIIDLLRLELLIL